MFGSCSVDHKFYTEVRKVDTKLACLVRSPPDDRPSDRVGAPGGNLGSTLDSILDLAGSSVEASRLGSGLGSWAVGGVGPKYTPGVRDGAYWRVVYCAGNAEYTR